MTEQHVWINVSFTKDRSDFRVDGTYPTLTACLEDQEKLVEQGFYPFPFRLPFRGVDSD